MDMGLLGMELGGLLAVEEETLLPIQTMESHGQVLEQVFFQLMEEASGGTAVLFIPASI